jgi:uncharacterized glyoxalase superfamily protein PhnB
MKRFYSEVLDFECIEDLGNYVEFRNKGVRFALTTPEVMYEGTEHSTYREERKGQSFELAFPLLTVDDVGRAYDEIVAKGATSINAPEMMPWGRMTAFFADPDGNIHELYSLREGEEI